MILFFFYYSNIIKFESNCLVNTLFLSFILLADKSTKKTFLVFF